MVHKNDYKVSARENLCGQINEEVRELPRSIRVNVRITDPDLGAGSSEEVRDLYRRTLPLVARARLVSEAEQQYRGSAD